MAQGAKTGGKDFVPGVSGNPKGRPRNSTEIEALRLQSRLEVMEAIARSLIMTTGEMESLLSDPGSTLIQRLVGSILDKAIKDGCPQRAQFFMNYLIGRPKPHDAETDKSRQEAGPPELLKGIPSAVLLEVLAKHREKALP